MTRKARSGKAKGLVSLVGAGPGDPGLITVAGLERLRQADVIVYDRLVSPILLEEAPEGAEIIFAGKEGGRKRLDIDQQAINDLLIAHARQGKRVVRLKGGDPFVFGRGGEEAEALRAAGVPFQVVPGVTSATAVPAYAGIPVTHRGFSSSFAVITGHEDPAKGASSLYWEKLATAVDTLVVLMATRTLSTVVEKLVAHGRSLQTPVAVIQGGTTPQQRTETGTLADIQQRLEKAGLQPPTLAVIGDVVSLRDTLAWYESRPLFGKRVLITRTRRQASALARLLSLEGAIPVELPAIEIQPTPTGIILTDAIEGLRAGHYRWVVFTSANAVELFFEALIKAKQDARAFGPTTARRSAGAKVAAIGPATAEALAQHGIIADVLPKEYIAEGVVEALGPHLRSGDCVLLPRAENARPELIEGLRNLGAEVDEVTLYRAAVPDSAPADALSLLRNGTIDIVTFTSSSTVRNLAALLGDDFRVILSGEDVGAGNVVSSRRNLRGAGGATAPVRERSRPLIACIGPVTAKTAEEVLGRPPDVVAQEYTVPGLVQALRERLENDESPI